MNLLALRSAVERRAGVSYDTTALTEVINEALDIVSTEHRWPWLQGLVWQPATVNGTAAYTPPTGWSSIRSVVVDSSTYERKSITEIDGNPYLTGWCVEGEQLVLCPTPGGGEVVKVRYDKTDPDLVADSDTPLLPAEWHGALVNLAAALVLERVHEWQSAEARRKDYLAAIRRMKRRARRETGARAPRVRAGGGL